MHASAFTALGLVVGSLALVPMGAAAAPGLDAYTLSAGGNSSCVTFGPDPLAALFGTYIQVGLPVGGGPCSVGVDSHAATAGGGSVQTASSLAVGFGAPGDLRSFVGSAGSRAAYGNLGVSAAASYGGNSDALTVAGSQAGARQIETMTFAGSGNGTYRPTFTIDGSFFSVGRTDSEIEFDYAVGNGPMFLAFRLLNSQGSLSLYANGGYQASLPGMTITGDAANGFTVVGSTTFTLNIPIVFGAPTDITFSLWAASVPRSNAGLLTASAGEVSFLNTARLTGIQVLDASGQPLDSFSITSGSGTVYGPGGVLSAVPEPGAWALMVAGLLVVSLRRPRA